MHKNKMMVKKTESIPKDAKELNKIDERAEQSEFQSKLTNGNDPLKGSSKPATPQNEGRKELPTTKQHSALGVKQISRHNSSLKTTVA